MGQDATSSASPRGLQRCGDLLHRIGAARRNILVHRAAEKSAVLHDDADALPQTPLIDETHVVAVDHNGSALRLFEAEEQPENRRFTRAGRTDDRRHLALLGDEGKVGQNQAGLGRISE